MTADKPKIAHKRPPPPEDDEWPSLPDGWPSYARALLGRKPSGIAIDFDPGKWTSIQAAFTRIRAVVGGRTAERDLNEDLRSARLTVARRWVSRRDGAHWANPPDGEMLCEQLKPSFWQGGRRAYTRAWPNDWTQIEVLDIGQDPSSLYYISRASLEKRYPLLEETSSASAPSPTVKGETAPPRRKRGPATTHDWHTIDGKIMRMCLDGVGRLAVPDKANVITQAILQEYENDDRVISETEVGEAVRRILAELRKGPNPLEKPRKR